jgi:hypothetical protein
MIMLKAKSVEKMLKNRSAEDPAPAGSGGEADAG